MENYYDILGVSETSTQDEIKKAYRKKAIEHHPDKGGDENTFKKISEAYDTIGDDGKRQQYDSQRRDPFGGGGFNPFGDMFGDMFANMNGGVRKNPDKMMDLNIGVVEAYTGGRKSINYMRNDKCDVCTGTGGDRQNCGTCGGQGFFVQRAGNGFFQTIQRVTCNSCHGKGYTYTKVCYSCHGEQTSIKMVNLDVELPRGVDDGTFFKSKGGGDYNNGSYADILFKVEIKPENNFEKMGSDLIYNYDLTIDDLQNEKLIVPHPDGDLSINFPDEIETKKPLRVKGKGFYPNGSDLYLKFNFKYKKSK